MLNLRKCRIGVVGLGYVGLPLAVEFGKHFDTVGLRHQAEPHRGARSRARQHARSRPSGAASRAKHLSFTTDLEDLKRCQRLHRHGADADRQYKRPDLTPLVRASESVGKVLKKGDVVVYESTVYPGLHRGDLRADPGARSRA